MGKKKKKKRQGSENIKSHGCHLLTHPGQKPKQLWRDICRWQLNNYLDSVPILNIKC